MVLRTLPLFALLLIPNVDDGWTTLQRGEEKIEIFRDEWGIPHIFAPSMEGAIWAQGWTEAADRFKQMDRFRRAGKGELAEIAGRDSLKQDIDVRKRGYTTAEMRKMVAAMNENSRKMLQAYADGVNAWLKKSKEDARPWDATDKP